jgi:PRA1 family protein
MVSEEQGSTATHAVEKALATVGGAASTATSWVTDQGSTTLVRGRPWLEFIDFSAFKPVAEGGMKEYGDRLYANARYFRFNYLQLGIFLALLSTVTQPICLLGTLCLIAAYFHLFGAEAEEEIVAFGVVLGHDEKMGALIILGFILFWFAAGGFALFSSIVCGTLFIMLLHGCLRLPAHDDAPAIPIP